LLCYPVRFITLLTQQGTINSNVGYILVHITAKDRKTWQESGWEDQLFKLLNFGTGRQSYGFGGGGEGKR
jgi:hypothetical protein